MRDSEQKVTARRAQEKPSIGASSNAERHGTLLLPVRLKSNQYANCVPVVFTHEIVIFKHMEYFFPTSGYGHSGKKTELLRLNAEPNTMYYT